MTNLPVETQILDEIERRLKQISKAKGFFTDEIRVVRASLQPFSGKDMPAINYWSSGDQLLESTGFVELRELELMVEFYDRHGEMPLNDKANLLSSDVKIALYRDPAHPERISTKLGGLVESVTVRSAIPAIGDERSAYCGSVITLTVRYRVDARYPFTLLG